jgi:hypothetical protein
MCCHAVPIFEWNTRHLAHQYILGTDRIRAARAPRQEFWNWNVCLGILSPRDQPALESATVGCCTPDWIFATSELVAQRLWLDRLFGKRAKTFLPLLSWITNTRLKPASF